VGAKRERRKVGGVTQNEWYREYKLLEAEVERLKALLRRAADALEDADWSTDYDDRWAHSELIAELRKAG
jgi:hypothetical protein